jgi:hypothetical protein
MSRSLRWNSGGNDSKSIRIASSIALLVASMSSHRAALFFAVSFELYKYRLPKSQKNRSYIQKENI